MRGGDGEGGIFACFVIEALVMSCPVSDPPSFNSENKLQCRELENTLQNFRDTRA